MTWSSKARWPANVEGRKALTVRFAEFFSLSDGKITALRIHYDGADYTRKGGR
ncbi:hypothetical protein [Arthrobacter sp. NPDC056727]|uniref:hypothetical protein n=1 Tax=Arthrobacter sp. NPDC056727 TaxID=3345927 RepID=UPI00366CBBD1